MTMVVKIIANIAIAGCHLSSFICIADEGHGDTQLQDTQVQPRDDNGS